MIHPTTNIGKMRNPIIHTLRLPMALAVAALSLQAHAQLHESINVEGKYVPEIIRADRVNMLPKAFRQTLTSSPIEYESSGVATAFSPSLLTMPPTCWGAARKVSSNPGYLELGAGSWLNSTLSAGYRFIDNSSTLFGVRLQHNSTSLWKPALSAATADVRQERYDESIALYASHIFKGHGRLDAALDYHVGYFNYYGYVPYGYTGESQVEAPTQTLNDVAMRLDWKSLIRPGAAVAYDATLRLRHFAYRNLPLPYGDREGSTKGTRETNVGLSAGVRMPWDNGSSIGIDGNLDMVFLSANGEEIFRDAVSGDFSLPKADDYAMLTLTPYYRFNRGLLDVRIGADIDLAFNAGPDGSRYSFFHIAPDVRLALQTGQVGLYLNMTGGSELNTLSRLHELDYYGIPRVVSTRPSYTPLDAAFGVNLGPFSGFSLGVEGRYRATKNTPLGGWYQAWIGNGDRPPVGLIPQVAKDASLGYAADRDGLNLHGASVSAKISYEYGDVFSIKAEGSYQPQDGKKGYFNGYDRAKATADVVTSFSPLKPLHISLGYHYRGSRAIYMNSFTTVLNAPTLINGTETTLHSLPLPDLHIANIAAAWDFSDSFSVWLQADNILNRHSELLPMQPMQGVVVAGGFKWLF